jgi:hypothetical protein
MRTCVRNAVLAALLSLTASPVGAAGMKLGGAVYGAFNTYSMSDVNTEVDNWNVDRLTFGAPTDLNHISNGFTGGIELRAWATPAVLVSLGWEPIFAETESRRETSNDGVSDITSYFRVNLDANVFSLSGAYFPPMASKGRVGFGGGIDYVSISGRFQREVQFSPPSPPDDENIDVDVSGSDIGFHAHAQGELAVSPGFELMALAGYRYLKVGDTKFDDQSDDPNAVTDYSGFIGRVGLVFYLPNGQ